MSVKWLLAGAGDIVRSRVAAALSQARDSEIAAVFALCGTPMNSAVRQAAFSGRNARRISTVL